MKIYKKIEVPELTYDAIKAIAKQRKQTLRKTSKDLLFQWTMIFWSDPERYGVKISDD